MPKWPPVPAASEVVAKLQNATSFFSKDVDMTKNEDLMQVVENAGHVVSTANGGK